MLSPGPNYRNSLSASQRLHFLESINMVITSLDLVINGGLMIWTGVTLLYN